MSRHGPDPGDVLPALRVTCPNPACRLPLKTRARNAGKRVLCPRCQTCVWVPPGPAPSPHPSPLPLPPSAAPLEELDDLEELDAPAVRPGNLKLWLILGGSAAAFLLFVGTIVTFALWNMQPRAEVEVTVSQKSEPRSSKEDPPRKAKEDNVPPPATPQAGSANNAAEAKPPSTEAKPPGTAAKPPSPPAPPQSLPPPTELIVGKWSGKYPAKKITGEVEALDETWEFQKAGTFRRVMMLGGATATLEGAYRVVDEKSLELGVRGGQKLVWKMTLTPDTLVIAHPTKPEPGAVGEGTSTLQRAKDSPKEVVPQTKADDRQSDSIKGKPDLALSDQVYKRLEKSKRRIHPFYAKTATGGKLEVENGKDVGWNDVVAGWHPALGWAWSSTFAGLDDGTVFVNIGLHPVTVSEVVIGKGECVVLRKGRLVKADLAELEAEEKPPSTEAKPPTPPPSLEVQGDLAKLQGTWKLVEIRWAEERSTSMLMVSSNHYLTFQGDQLTERHEESGGKVAEAKYRFEVDSRRQPPVYRQTALDGEGKTTTGLYAVSGDSLKICSVKNGLPKDMNLVQGQEVKDKYLYVYQRKQP